MALNIKQKIRLGTIFLLLLLVVSGVTSIYYQVALMKASENILEDNYESLEYCRSMDRKIDSLATATVPSGFDSLLSLQEANITEPGEREATRDLKAGWIKLQANTSDIAARKEMKEALDRILSLNMKAIERKNREAQRSAQGAYAVIIVVISITCMIGLTFTFNFPDVVVSPIRKLIAATSEISARNYSYRIHMDRQDEFGQLAQAFNTMSERLESFENSNLNKLIFEKARAEAVINSLKDASIGIDGNGKILFANQMALELLGLTAEQTVGRNVTELAGKNDLLRYLLENENTAPFKIVVEGRENYYIRETVEVKQTGQSSRVIVLKNITSFKELDTAKTNFIATVSHELKTPLASSDFSLKLLEDERIGQLSNEQKELVQQLKDDNRRMLRILSELLNLSQVEAGRLQVNMEAVSPYVIIDHAIGAVSNMAKEKNIRIEQQVPQNLPVMYADADKTGWVLINFFTNAIKFSPTDSLVLLRVEAAGDKLRFSVADHGPGIDSAYESRVFERYFQVPGRTANKGSGIGLAICKDFIEAMNGTVAVSSSPGEGSIFSFELFSAGDTEQGH
ncbi:sensor histidine kinase [Sediminibacterium ginsengisoli]|nr:ATP-binding protein [Sediminibacterium ginsengisoli]